MLPLPYISTSDNSTCRNYYWLFTNICSSHSRRDCFEEVWHRWENNNLRFKLSKFFEYIDKYKLPYKKIAFFGRQRVAADASDNDCLRAHRLMQEE